MGKSLDEYVDLGVKANKLGVLSNMDSQEIKERLDAL